MQETKKEIIVRNFVDSIILGSFVPYRIISQLPFPYPMKSLKCLHYKVTEDNLNTESFHI